MREPNHERIWLICDEEAEESVTWSDTPNPYAEYGEQPDAAIEYVRADAAAERIEHLTRVLEGLVRRFDRRDWVLSGDDSKALFHARDALSTIKGEGSKQRGEASGG